MTKEGTRKSAKTILVRWINGECETTKNTGTKNKYNGLKFVNRESDWDENFFDGALKRDEKPHVFQDRRKTIRKTAREAVQAPLISAADAGKLHFIFHFSKNKTLHLKVYFTEKSIDENRKQIQTLRASLKLAGKMFAAKVIDGSDPRAALPDFHQAVVQILITKMRKHFMPCIPVFFVFN